MSIGGINYYYYNILFQMFLFESSKEKQQRIMVQTKIEEIISGQKRNKNNNEFLIQFCNNSDKKVIQKIVDKIKETIKDQQRTPRQKYNAIQLLKEIMTTRNKVLGNYVVKKILQRLVIFAKWKVEDKKQTEDSRGRTIFGTVSADQQTYSKRFYTTLLECLNDWGNNWPKHADGPHQTFKDTYKELIFNQVQFPKLIAGNNSTSNPKSKQIALQKKQSNKPPVLQQKKAEQKIITKSVSPSQQQPTKLKKETKNNMGTSKIDKPTKTDKDINQKTKIEQICNFLKNINQTFELIQQTLFQEPLSDIINDILTNCQNEMGKGNGYVGYLTQKPGVFNTAIITRIEEDFDLLQQLKKDVRIAIKKKDQYQTLKNKYTKKFNNRQIKLTNFQKARIDWIKSLEVENESKPAEKSNSNSDLTNSKNIEKQPSSLGMNARQSMNVISTLGINSKQSMNVVSTLGINAKQSMNTITNKSQNKIQQPIPRPQQQKTSQMMEMKNNELKKRTSNNQSELNQRIIQKQKQKNDVEKKLEKEEQHKVVSTSIIKNQPNIDYQEKKDTGQAFDFFKESEDLFNKKPKNKKIQQSFPATEFQFQPPPTQPNKPIKNISENNIKKDFFDQQQLPKMNDFFSQQQNPFQKKNKLSNENKNPTSFNSKLQQPKHRKSTQSNPFQKSLFEMNPFEQNSKSKNDQNVNVSIPKQYKSQKSQASGFDLKFSKALPPPIINNTLNNKMNRQNPFETSFQIQTKSVKNIKSDNPFENQFSEKRSHMSQKSNPFEVSMHNLEKLQKRSSSNVSNPFDTVSKKSGKNKLENPFENSLEKQIQKQKKKNIQSQGNPFQETIKKLDNINERNQNPFQIASQKKSNPFQLSIAAKSESHKSKKQHQDFDMFNNNFNNNKDVINSINFNQPNKDTTGNDFNFNFNNIIQGRLDGGSNISQKNLFQSKLVTNEKKQQFPEFKIPNHMSQSNFFDKQVQFQKNDFWQNNNEKYSQKDENLFTQKNQPEPKQPIYPQFNDFQINRPNQNQGGFTFEDFLNFGQAKNSTSVNKKQSPQNFFDFDAHKNQNSMSYQNKQHLDQNKSQATFNQFVNPDPPASQLENKIIQNQNQNIHKNQVDNLLQSRYTDIDIKKYQPPTSVVMNQQFAASVNARNQYNKNPYPTVPQYVTILQNKVNQQKQIKIPSNQQFTKNNNNNNEKSIQINPTINKQPEKIPFPVSITPKSQKQQDKQLKFEDFLALKKCGEPWNPFKKKKNNFIENQFVFQNNIKNQQSLNIGQNLSINSNKELKEIQVKKLNIKLQEFKELYAQEKLKYEQQLQSFLKQRQLYLKKVQQIENIARIKISTIKKHKQTLNINSEREKYIIQVNKQINKLKQIADQKKNLLRKLFEVKMKKSTKESKSQSRITNVHKFMAFNQTAKMLHQLSGKQDQNFRSPLIRSRYN